MSTSTCWLCDRPIEEPPLIIGRILAGEKRVAHLECLRYVGEIELGLRAEKADPGTITHETFPGRP